MSEKPNKKGKPESNAGEPESIGVATMLEDGTISMMLRAEGPGNVRGDAVMTYPKSHPHYSQMLKHVGGLKVGKEKLVPPFPEE